jgi:hypothetical protein
MDYHKNLCRKIFIKFINQVEYFLKSDKMTTQLIHFKAYLSK